MNPLEAAAAASKTAESSGSTTAATATPSMSSSTAFSFSPPSSSLMLMDLALVDRLISVATKVSVIMWFFLVLLVYSLVPPEEYIYLKGPEQEAAATAAYLFMVSLTFMVAPLMVRQYSSSGSGKSKSTSSISSIVRAAITTMGIAMITNSLLAWAPTVVLVDPYSHARVYLLRWCEWIPLAGLMTFLSEILDCNTANTTITTSGSTSSGSGSDITKSPALGLVMPVLVALGQSLSCLMAIIFPLCPTFAAWLLSMILSVTLYATIFPRLWFKYKAYQKLQDAGMTLTDMEVRCRVRFGYHLFLTCTIVWTVLVVMYFVNFWAFHYRPDSAWVKNQSLPMIIDTAFDVLAKSLYMKIIVEVHEAVFDAEGRTRRQLSELKRMISVLWESSSDVIFISVRSGNTLNTMISPTFPVMLGAETALSRGQTNNGDSSKRLIQDVSRTALIVKSERVPVMDNSVKPNGNVNQAFRLNTHSYFVEGEIPYDTREDSCLYFPTAEMEHFVTKQAEHIISAAWEDIEATERQQQQRESLLVRDLEKRDGSLLKSEIKVSRHAGEAVIAVVRDVTERYLRFEAERRAHTEALARQRDAHAVNRFTKHEIKNGLLAGIELCQEVSKRIDALRANSTIPIEDAEKCDANKSLAELDVALHEVLDTVLTEAMAREVVHESYQPKLERVDVFEVLSCASGETTRFPINICPPDMPFLLLDPQLLRYIHRNAVSNACKYGRHGWRVTTEVHYFAAQSEFELDVINEPGVNHTALIQMGEQACAAVFAQGIRLPAHKKGARGISTGDGAWIMQKCAKTLGGTCSIRFDPHQTVFSFRCKVEPYQLPWKTHEQFQVPSSSWGVAFDDTAIQRKLMTRIMQHAGVEESKVVVLGEKQTDVEGLHDLLLQLLSKDANSRVLVLMDENLDYDCDGVAKRLSGSLYTERALTMLDKDHQSRVLALIRSANDSDSDITLYTQRAHGFFPKACTSKERVRESLAPRWYERFPHVLEHDTQTEGESQSDVDENETSYSDFGDIISGEEILASMHKVDEVLARETPEGDWDTIWSKLHAFKGDLMAVGENKKLQFCVDMITEFRAGRPGDFCAKWADIRTMVLKEYS